MAQDELHIQILEDGTIKTSTGQFSPANHQSAEQFLADVARLTGGAVLRNKQPHAHPHVRHQVKVKN